MPAQKLKQSHYRVNMSLLINSRCYYDSVNLNAGKLLPCPSFGFCFYKKQEQVVRDLYVRTLIIALYSEAKVYLKIF